MVLNAAVQMLREADNLKEKIAKFKSGTSMVQERSIWTLQQQLQQVYQKVLVLDLNYALDKKVEQDLWNFGFKQQIEALQAIAKDRKSALRSDGQAMLSWILQAATGYYLCLLHQICTTFKLDLPFRRRASLLGCVEGWGAAGEVGGTPRVLPPPAAARYICQHCLVHLGDLARYRQQLRVAYTFYRQALLVSADSGQPYNQLALVARRRGRPLCAAYWHARSLLVRAPFPPATANLVATLAASHRDYENGLPVIPGITSKAAKVATPPTRLDSHNYVDHLLKALYLIHILDDLDTVTELVNTLNLSLTPLVATDSFDSITLIKMTCIIIWLVHSCYDELNLASNQMTEAERRGGALALQLAVSGALALLLPAYTRQLASPTLPALKVCLQWWVSHPQLLQSAALRSKPQLWAALAHALNQLAPLTQNFNGNLYTTIPLPEDEELHGFVPLEAAFSALKFNNYASWDTYGDRLPSGNRGEDDTFPSVRCPSDMTEDILSKQPELEHKLRAYRLVEVGRGLADLLEKDGQDCFTVVKENDTYKFSASTASGEQLRAALSELSLLTTKSETSGDSQPTVDNPAPATGDVQSTEDGAAEVGARIIPPPIFISEADFKDKVREKRVGILKPQGSLERAREERALASTQDDQKPETEAECDENAATDESKKEYRKVRMNVAMAAILRKQEETSKQVKFVTPASTPDSVTETIDTAPAIEEKQKIIQPKPIKSLTNLPLGKKTGGILSLKDKSAGYPHLVNTDTKPEDKKADNIVKVTNSSSQSSQTTNFVPARKEPLLPTPNVTNYNPRMTFHPNKPSYGLQNTGIHFNPTYQPQSNLPAQGIRLPVVNPKEIDVRSAAIQKQNSRDAFPDGAKYHASDKQNFLNDLPPRFANQYRYWQQNQTENQFNPKQENTFRDDNSFTKTTNNLPGFSNNMPPRNNNWIPNASNLTNQENYTPQQAPPYWKPETYNTSFQNPNPSIPNNYYINSNPYQNPMVPNFQPPLQNLQTLVQSSNYNSPLNSFGTYGQTVGYDAGMYPQFPSTYTERSGPEAERSGLFSDSQRNPFSYTTEGNTDTNVMKNPMDNMTGDRGASYSLFSAQDAAAWNTLPPPPQSLWCGPGPSPLERLLEQQKQGKQPPTDPH